MNTYRRTWSFIVVTAALVSFPALASAQESPIPNIPMPNGQFQMPNIQQFPGGLQILMPQGPTITITDPTGVLFPNAGQPNAGQPNAGQPNSGQPNTPPTWTPNWPTPNIPNVQIPGLPPSWTPTWPSPANPNIPPTQPPVQPAPGANQPGQGGQVYGVFSGITNYNSGNDLPHCAEDAIRLAQAFVQAGIISQSNAVVLTDQQATRVNITNAIRQLGSRMGPNDTLVFFFSGHGDRQADTNGDEQDGMDETIVLNDGSLVDDELTALLQNTAGRDFVALDTCFAGGFQHDVAQIPQSVGFYSSGENQTSNVASELGAGGYLSHFMRTGVEGSRGQGLQVAGLRQHIEQGYMSSGANGRQQLVVGTGPGVSGQTVLFNANTPGGYPGAVASR